jgi:DNA-directed RNA polymerase subunit alpha
MIEADGDVEILDKNVYLATLSEGGKLDMEMRLKRGRGYISADKNFDADLGWASSPWIQVHSPVRKRQLPGRSRAPGPDHRLRQADPGSVDQRHRAARRRVGLAAKLLKDHMNIFINFEEEIEAEARGEEGRILLRNDNLNRSAWKSWSSRCAATTA